MSLVSFGLANPESPELTIAQVEELVKSKLEKPKTLRQLAARHWAEIERGTLRFDRQEREAAALRTLTKQDVTAFFQVGEVMLLEPECCSMLQRVFAVTGPT